MLYGAADIRNSSLVEQVMRLTRLQNEIVKGHTVLSLSPRMQGKESRGFSAGEKTSISRSSPELKKKMKKLETKTRSLTV